MKYKLAWSTDPWSFILLGGRSLTGGCFADLQGSIRPIAILWSFLVSWSNPRSVDLFRIWPYDAPTSLLVTWLILPFSTFLFFFFETIQRSKSLTEFTQNTQIYLKRNTAVVLSHIHTLNDRCVPCLTIKHLVLVAHWTVLLLYSHYSILFCVLQLADCKNITTIFWIIRRNYAFCTISSLQKGKAVI